MLDWPVDRHGSQGIAAAWNQDTAQLSVLDHDFVTVYPYISVQITKFISRTPIGILEVLLPELKPNIPDRSLLTRPPNRPGGGIRSTEIHAHLRLLSLPLRSQ